MDRWNIVDKILKSKKNGENVLRYGMTGEAKIITRQKNCYSLFLRN
jgi:hypothetical protein